MRELEDAFEGASNLLWSNADHHSSEVSSLFSISVTNIVLGDWEICNRSCIQILMNQWYDVYQSLREKNKIKKSHEELETKKETSFLNGIIENVEGTLKSAYSSAMYLASNFDEIYQTARQFIFENSVLVPVTFPFPIHLHPSAKVGVYFWIKSKNKKAHTFIHIDSIEKAVLKNGQDALKITFNSKSKSIPMLVKGILFHEIEQINHVVFKIDDKKFTFLRRVQIEV
ncbi:hypothetical protein HMI55_007233 [Coelomomyces lativittatus]|nr:hypothetical protein HMI55_007233 [Coelomomyces lativittatus]